MLRSVQINSYRGTEFQIGLFDRFEISYRPHHVNTYKGLTINRCELISVKSQIGSHVKALLDEKCNFFALHFQ